MARYEIIVDTSQLTRPGAEIIISGHEGRHMARVRRIRAGIDARLKDGLGKAFSATVLAVKGDTVRFLLEESLPCPDDRLPVTLMPAIIKGRRMDWLIQKACELGAREIQPVLTRRTVVKNVRGSGRLNRWTEIAHQALKQCSGNMLTRILAPLPLISRLEDMHVSFKIMLHEDRGGRSIPSVLQEAGSCACFSMLTGPEGGFSREELKQCMEHGFITASLGPRILRAETAALAALSQLAGFFHDRA